MADQAAGQKRERDSGDSRSKKRKYFSQAGNKAKEKVVPLQSCGFLISCDTNNEDKAARNFITAARELECVAKLLPKKDEPQDGAEKEQGAKDVTLAQGLADELKSLKDGASESERPGPKESWIRLSRGVVYVALETLGLDLSDGQVAERLPLKIVDDLFEDIRKTNKPFSRFCQRILPVQSTCRANLQDICEASKALILKHFNKTQFEEYAIVYQSRNNTELSREKVIDAVAALVPDGHKVNLTSPAVVVLVDIHKRTCCTSVLRGYHEKMKLNVKSFTKSLCTSES